VPAVPCVLVVVVIPDADVVPNDPVVSDAIAAAAVMLVIQNDIRT
jgi:hypothetical protein